jgi:apolipoprotein N-acyltransferase
MSAAALGAVVTGLVLGASFLDFRLYVLGWAGAAMLLAVVDGHTPRRAFGLGFVTGGVGLALAFSWLAYALRVFGGFPAILAVVLSVVPIAWMALQLGVFGAVLAWLGPLPLGLAAPLAYTAVEFLFPSLFPWRLAHSQYHVPVLLQSGELAGPFALTFAMVWTGAAALAVGRAIRHGTPAARHGSMRWVALPIAVVVGLLGYGYWRLTTVEALRQTAPALRVGMVQGNVSVEHKGQQAFFTRNLEDYRRLSREVAADTDLLVWPETVFQRHIPVSLSRLPEAYHPFPDTPRPLIFGGLAVRRSPHERLLFNSAFLVRPDGTVVSRYDKRVLVPFGEYMPLGDRFPRLRTLSPATGNFRPGTGPIALTAAPGARIGTLICYEDVVPRLARAAVRSGATVLLNLTNDAWYGDGAQPHQHQALAIWRAVETRRDFLRVTNTGVSSAIAASGRRIAELPTFEARALAVEVRLLTGITPYVAYGDVFGWTVVLALAGAAVRRWRRGPAPPCKPATPV